MTDHHRVLVVGDPPGLRQQVAQALDQSADTVGWISDPNELQNTMADPGSRADVLVLSASLGEEWAIELAQIASREWPASAVLLVDVTGSGPNGALPSYMRAGVRDVIRLKDDDDLQEALSRALAWSKGLHAAREEDALKEAKRGAVFTVFSSKGGTGKTFLATNLACALANITQRDTAVVDLDVAMGDVFSYFGTEPIRSLQEMLSLGRDADRSTLLAAGKVLGDHLWGFGAPPDPGAADVPAEKMTDLIDAMSRAFDFTVVDSPAGYSDEVLPALDHSDRVLLVASLDIVGIRHLTKAIETLTSIGMPKDRLTIVLNRSDSKVGLEIADVERVTKIHIDTLIPSSRLVPTYLNQGRPVYLVEPKAEVSRAIEDLAHRLVGMQVPPPPPEAAHKSRFRLRRG